MCDVAIDAAGDLVDLDRTAVLAQVEGLAAAGLRVLAFAEGPGPHADKLAHGKLGPLVFVGLQAMIDPPRQEAIAAVATCHTAGISVKMITGDHSVTASAIAERMGLGRGTAACPEGHCEALTGSEIEGFSDDDLQERIERLTVFARVSPEQKLRLVRALQSRGHVVAMTGDGVNDAPALRQADIGVAMGVTGTDVAKEAADMVLTDDNFASIEAAVEEGRGVFDNIVKFITWTLPTNLGEGLVILAAIFAGTSLPILPVQILWINMTTAVFLGLMLAFEPNEPDIMVRPPRAPETPILTRMLMWRVVFVGMLLLAAAFGLFEWAQSSGHDLAVARTLAVNVFVAVELFYLFNCRSLTKSLLGIPPFSNRWVLGGVGLMVALQLAYTYVPFMNTAFGSAPLSAGLWGVVAAVGVAAMILVEIEKRITRAANQG
jgi:Ca2+-transporting ATPase